jgi:hypothetical protein
VNSSRHSEFNSAAEIEIPPPKRRDLRLSKVTGQFGQRVVRDDDGGGDGAFLQMPAALR